MMKLDTAKLPTKPDKYTVSNNKYECLTCVPKVDVKADGTDQKVTGHPYYDTVAVHVVDASSIEIIEKKDGKVMYTDKETVSTDGKTLNDKFTDNNRNPGRDRGDHVHAGGRGTGRLARDIWSVAREQVQHMSSNGLTVTYQGTADGLKMSDQNGNSYDAKFDGKDYPINGDPGHTMVSVKRIGKDTIEETDKRDGKIVGVYRMTISSDGKSIHAEYNDKEHGTTMSFTMEKQS